MDDDKIVLTTDDGEEIEYTLLESTVLGGVTYILVTEADDEDEDGMCYILKDVSEPDSEEAIYESVEDDKESDAVFAVFRDMLKGEIDLEG